MPVRIGVPQNITGLVDEILKPAFATSVGLVLYGIKLVPKESQGMFNQVGKFTGKLPVKGILGKIVDILKPFLP